MTTAVIWGVIIGWTIIAFAAVIVIAAIVLLIRALVRFRRDKGNPPRSAIEGDR